MKETREQKMERKVLRYFRDSKRGGIFCSSSQWAHNGKGSEMPFDTIHLLQSQSDVHQCVILCCCQFKKNGGAGVSYGPHWLYAARPDGCWVEVVCVCQKNYDDCYQTGAHRPVKMFCASFDKSWWAISGKLILAAVRQSSLHLTDLLLVFISKD